MMTVKAAAHKLGINAQTVRRHIPLHRVGRRVLVSQEDIFKLAGRPCGRTLAWEAMRLWDVNRHRPLCDDKADLLASTVSGFLIENPDGETTSDDFVAYALANPPAGGGDIGAALRRDIQAEALIRGIKL